MRLVDLRALRKLCGRADEPTMVSYGVSLPKKELEKAGWKEGDLLEIWFDEARDVFVLKRKKTKEGR